MKEYIEEVKKAGIKELAISYYFELHDEISMIPRAFLEELFCEILRRGLKVRVNCYISKRNFRNIAEHCNFCLKLGIQKIRFTNFLKQGNADDLDDKTFLSDADRTEFFELIEFVRKDIPKEILEIERCGSSGRNLKKQNFYCGG